EPTASEHRSPAGVPCGVAGRAAGSPRKRGACGAFSWGAGAERARRRAMSTATERSDVLVVGSGFGGAIAAYHLAAGGARVTVLERGPWLTGKDFDHDYLLGSSYTRVFDFVAGEGMSVLGGNCVGGGSVVYFAALPRAPRFVFER